MSQKEVKKCPKCGGEMEKGERLTFYGRLPIPQAVTFAKEGDFFGDKIIPFYCKNCSYIELYKTPSTPKVFVKKCVKCSKEIPLASEECPHCGAKQSEYEEP